MNSVILTKTYSDIPFCEKEILRYAGCKTAGSEISSLLKTCINEAEERLIYRVCYREFPVQCNGDVCDFGAFRLRSRDISANLNGCENVIIFAATVGVDIDRLIAKYGRISPSKALMFQAIGAERIEALCDEFCREISKEKNTAMRPRFSPGYGDLPLTVQRELFGLLDCGKHIGLFLNDSLLMSPSKSVTAFVGLCQGGKNTNNIKNKCGSCDKTDCAFRGAL